MWFRFERDFDFSPAAMKGRVTTAYKAGMTMNVTRECAELATVAKAGSPVKPAAKENSDGDEAGGR